LRGGEADEAIQSPLPHGVIPDNALGALIRNLAELEKIPGSPLRGVPE
jgi:hypothetical protein